MAKINNNSHQVKKSPKNKEDVILTPYKYNGGQLYEGPKKPHYTANVDKAIFNVNGEIPTDKESISFDDGNIHLIIDPKRPNGVRHFKCCYEIYLHGELFALMNTAPRASILDPFLSSITIQNNVLYQRGWVARFEYLCKEIGVELRGVSQLDIAIDGGEYIAQYEKLLSKEYKKVGRAKMATEHKHNGNVEGFYIGNRSSEKYIRGYNKTLEMKKSGSNKNYIVDFWKNNGLDPAGKVERLEIVLKNKAIKRIKDFDIGRLEDSGYLASLMKCQLTKYYQFVENNGDTNVTRKEKIDAVDWSFFENMEDVVREKKTKTSNVIWAVKRALTFDMKEQFAGMDELGDDLFSQTYIECYKRAEMYGVKEWFGKKITQWKKDFEYQQKIKNIIKTVSKNGHFSTAQMMNV